MKNIWSYDHIIKTVIAMISLKIISSNHKMISNNNLQNITPPMLAYMILTETKHIPPTTWFFPTKFWGFEEPTTFERSFKTRHVHWLLPWARRGVGGESRNGITKKITHPNRQGWTRAQPHTMTFFSIFWLITPLSQTWIPGIQYWASGNSKVPGSQLTDVLGPTGPPSHPWRIHGRIVYSPIHEWLILLGSI